MDERRRDLARATALAGLALAVLAAALALLPPAGATHGTAPTCTILPSGPAGQAGWWTGEVTVAIEAGPGVTGLDYSHNGGTYAYSGPFTISSDGEHAVACHARDHDDQVGSSYATILVDASDPTCRGSYAAAQSYNGWYLAHSTYDLSTSDQGPSGVATILSRVDGGGWGPYQAPIPLGDGRHVVECIVRDEAGNEGAFTALVNVDATPPTACRVGRVHDPALNADVPGANGWHGVSSLATHGAHVYMTADDAGSGAAWFSIVVDGGSHLVPNGTAFAVYEDGERTLSCKAQDEAGHARAFDLPLRLDGGRPTCRGAYAGTPGTNNWHRTGAFVLTAEDGLSGVAWLNWTVDGAPRSIEGAPGATQARAEIASEGVQRVTCLATDRAGLTSGTSTFTVRLDVTAPECAILVDGPGGSNGWHRGAATVRASASDAASGVAGAYLSLDGGKEAAYVSPVAVRGDGEHAVACRALDRAGNERVARETVRVDQTPPSPCVSVARGADGRALEARGGWYARALDLDLSTRDDASGLASVSVRLDGRPVPGVPTGGAFSNVTLRLDARGEHVIECDATDRAGNAAERVTLRVNVDDELPACAAQAVGEERGGWLRGAATVRLEGSDAGSGLRSLRWRLDGGEERPYEGPIPLKGDGNHRLECVARDAAGNEATRVVDLRVDATPPACAYAPEVDAGIVHAGAARVALEARDATSGVASVQVRVNGGVPGPYDAPFELSGAGIHEVACLVEDEAGNAREILLERIRVEEPAREVRPAAVPLARDAATKTAQPIPGAGAAWMAAATAAAAWVAARRRGP